jgi:hypothetical protein
MTSRNWTVQTTKLGFRRPSGLGFS